MELRSSSSVGATALLDLAQKISQKNDPQPIKINSIRKRVHEVESNARETSNAPSIPSKYETVVFSGIREKKGFGSHSARFIDKLNSDPGPSDYADINSNTAFDKANASFNVQGFGNFISRSRRFTSRTSGIAPRPGPGPGNYSPNRLKKKTSNSHVGLDSAFCLPKNSNNTSTGRPLDSIKHHFETPNVGLYHPINEKDISRSIKGHQSIFKSAKTSDRQIGMKMSVAPPVGWYQVENGPFKKSYGASHVFANPSDRLQKSVNEREFPLPQNVKFDLKAVDGLVKEVKSYSSDPPPVGSYVGHEQWQPEANVNQSIIGSASFVAKDSFGRSKYLNLSHSLPSLGPGTYNAKDLRKPRMKGLVSMDAATKRQFNILKDAPGPAFYTPKTEVIQPHRSFHLNVHDKWM